MCNHSDATTCDPTMAKCTEQTGAYSDQLSESVLRAYCQLAGERAMLEFRLETRPVSGLGDNSYGLVLQVKLTPTRTLPSLVAVPPFYSIVKISPKHAARRAHMHVVDYYRREVFMYDRVIGAFVALVEESERRGVEVDGVERIAPKMLYHSLAPEDEFIIFEDMAQRQFAQNLRSHMPTEDLVTSALVTLAQLHALSFVLQAKQPHTFATLVSQMRDNLFTDDMEPVNVEFGKKYVRRTRTMLEADLEHRPARFVDDGDRRTVCVGVLDKVEQEFKKICLRCVDGTVCAPYSVICHGDFWNNNILYRYDENERASSATLIDFQMSRYAAPVLDVVHYLFACTEKTLRDTHFQRFVDSYYGALAEQLQQHSLDAADIYPRVVYTQQLRDFGIYGLCMASFAVPFFISNTSELPDLDKVAEAVQDLYDNLDGEAACNEGGCASNDAGDSDNLHELLDNYYLLTPRTEPIFRRRMIGIVNDLVLYQMVEPRLLPTTMSSPSDDH